MFVFGFNTRYEVNSLGVPLWSAKAQKKKPVKMYSHSCLSEIVNVDSIHDRHEDYIRQ